VSLLGMYIACANHTADASRKAAAVKRICFIESPTVWRTWGPVVTKDDIVESERQLFQLHLQAVLRLINRWRFGFTLRLFGVLTYCVPFVSSYVADIVEANSVGGFSSHFSHICDARARVLRHSNFAVELQRRANVRREAWTADAAAVASALPVGAGASSRGGARAGAGGASGLVRNGTTVTGSAAAARGRSGAVAAAAAVVVSDTPSVESGDTTSSSGCSDAEAAPARRAVKKAQSRGQRAADAVQWAARGGHGRHHPPEFNRGAVYAPLSPEVSLQRVVLCCYNCAILACCACVACGCRP
jgi:hypothetical protein